MAGLVLRSLACFVAFAVPQGPAFAAQDTVKSGQGASPSAPATDNQTRRKLKVGDPSNPTEVQTGLPAGKSAEPAKPK